MAQPQKFITEEGRERLSDELKDLRAVRRPAVAARIHAATVSGGAADNAEYEDAKNEQAFVEGRIRDIERILSDSVAVRKSAEADGKVRIGSTVTVKAPNGQTRRFTIVGSAEAKPLEGRISNESPVGQALLNREVGDAVEIATRAGNQKLTIVRAE